MLETGTSSVTPNVDATKADYYPVTSVYGFTDCGADYMTNNGFRLIAGIYPANKTEIAIPEYVANLFIETEGSGVEEISQIIGKKLRFSNVQAIPSSEAFTIVGVYNVGEIPAKYNQLKESTSTQLSTTERKDLKASLQDFITGSFNNLIYVSEDFYVQYKNNIPSNNSGVNINSSYTRGLNIQDYEITEDYQEWWGSSVYTEKTVQDYSKYFKFYKLNGQ